MQKEKKQSEDKIQSDCYVWFHNTYPQHRGLLCYNLNNSKNKIDGARNKAKGLIAGRSDMVLYYDAKAFMIEFKTSDGVQSAGQKEWEALVRSNGFQYHIIRSLPEFQSLILSILK
jgi:hypothetical protein